MAPRAAGTEMSAAGFLPRRAGDLDALRRASAGCRGCGLYAPATQTVFGGGDVRADVVLVGEQPGDQEDRIGEPFVGPAGRLLREAMAEAGLDEGSAYFTNAMKHFKFEPRGKVRLHKKPSAAEVAACRPWLEAELEAVRPAVVVALGVTAGQALLGRSFRVSKDRGAPREGPGGAMIVATAHPSSVLRARNHGDRAAQRGELVADLAVVAGLLRQGELSRPSRRQPAR